MPDARNLPSTYQQVLDNMDSVEILDQRVVNLETTIDAATVTSVNGSQLPLNVIPKGAMERVFDVSAISIMADKSASGYPADAGNGDTIRDIGDGNKMYFISDETKLGSADYMDGLQIYTAGYAANAGLVDGHVVEQDVRSTSKLTDTISSAYCTTSAGEAAKTAICEGYVLTAGNWLQVLITKSNTAATQLTLDVNNTGAKPIYINDYPSTPTNYVLPAGCYFAYYGSRVINDAIQTGYFFRTDGDLPNVAMPQVMVGADDTNAGKVGTVPAPNAGYQNRVLSGAGTWIRHPNIEIVSSATQPTGQQTGDYWLETLT